jgi:hypothetical protein
MPPRRLRYLLRPPACSQCLLLLGGRSLILSLSLRSFLACSIMSSAALLPSLEAQVRRKPSGPGHPGLLGFSVRVSRAHVDCTSTISDREPLPPVPRATRTIMLLQRQQADPAGRTSPPTRNGRGRSSLDVQRPCSFSGPSNPSLPIPLSPETCQQLTAPQPRLR